MAHGRYGDIGKKHMEPGWTNVWMKVTVSSGTPTLTSDGRGVASVARSSEGKWLITLNEGFVSFKGGYVSYLGGTTEVGRVHQFAAASGSAATITLWFYDTASPGNLRDPPDVTVYIKLDIDEMD